MTPRPVVLGEPWDTTNAPPWDGTGIPFPVDANGWPVIPDASAVTFTGPTGLAAAVGGWAKYDLTVVNAGNAIAAVTHTMKYVRPGGPLLTIAQLGLKYTDPDTSVVTLPTRVDVADGALATVQYALAEGETRTWPWEVRITGYPGDVTVVEELTDDATGDVLAHIEYTFVVTPAALASPGTTLTVAHTAPDVVPDPDTPWTAGQSATFSDGEFHWDGTGWVAGPVVVDEGTLSGWTVAELREFAADHEPPIDIPSSANKAQIIALILAALEGEDD